MSATDSTPSDARRDRDAGTPGVTVTLLQPLAVYLTRAGYDAVPLLRAWGLSPADLQSPTRRLPEDQLRGIWQQAVGLTGDLALGVRVAQMIEPKALGLLGYVLTNAARVGQALRLWERFNRLLLDEPLWRHVRRDARTDAFVGQRGARVDAQLSRPAVEFATCSLHRITGFLAAIDDEPQRYLCAVEFRHREPPQEVMAAYREVFGPVPLQFEATHNSVVFDRRLLALPIADADRNMLARMRLLADQQLRALATESDIVARVRAAIRRRMVGQAPSLASIAADCNVSRATLQRKLAASGTGFQALLDEQRFALAQELLAEPEMTVEEIGFVLGYADAAAFQHAFRRWAGCPPGAYRQRQQG